MAPFVLPKVLSLIRSFIIFGSVPSRRCIIHQARHCRLTIQGGIECIVDSHNWFQASVKVQCFITLEWAAEMIGLHLVGFVKAIVARVDSCGTTLAVFSFVYLELKAVFEVEPLAVFSHRLREIAWYEGVGGVGVSDRCDSDQSGREDPCHACKAILRNTEVVVG